MIKDIDKNYYMGIVREILKPILLIVFLLGVHSATYSEVNMDINDYRIFVSAKKKLEQKKYSQADAEFKKLINGYSRSSVFKTKYAYYFIGKTKYHLKKYSEAVKYLKKAVYVPVDYKTTTKKRKDLFEYERNYLMALSYKALGNERKTVEHLKNNVRSYYDIELVEYERKSIKMLMQYDPYYETVYKVKYLNDFDLLIFLKEDDLLELGDYFMSKGEYKKAEVLYATLSESNDSTEIKEKVLRALTQQRKYDSVIRIATGILVDTKSSGVYYYLGNAYRRNGELDNAIENLLKVKKGEYYDRARYATGKLYYVKKQYTKAVSQLRGVDSRKARTLKIKSYLKSNNTDSFMNAAIDQIKKKPYSDEAAYYRFLMYKQSGDKNILKWIKRYNVNSYYHELATVILGGDEVTFPKFPLEKYFKENPKTMSKLSSLSKLGDKEILKIELDKLNFYKKDEVFKQYLTSAFYALSGFYYESLVNTYKNQYLFSQYNETMQLLYPKYYSKEVESSARKNGVDPLLVYSIMKQESNFRKTIVSKAAAYGLMQIIVPTAKRYNKKIGGADLLVPDINIEVGTRHIKRLLKHYNGNVTKVVAAYNAGEGAVDRWSKRGAFKIDNIPYAETQNYTKKVLNNYSKYKLLYR